MAVEEVNDSHEQPERPELDVGRIEPDTMPLRVLRRITKGRGKGFAVVVQRSALDAIHAHGGADTSVEICGVLIGNLRHDRKGPYLLIEGIIKGDQATNKQTQVTFTAETWDSIQKEMEKHPDKKIVGWYHTHPGFGVFLSGMDLFIQDNFFNLPWQVAWVHDPVAMTDGAFIWRLGKSEKTDYLIEEDGGDRSHDFRGALDPSRSLSATNRPSSFANMVRIIVVFMIFFLLAWFLLQWMTNHGFRVRLPIER